MRQAMLAPGGPVGWIGRGIYLGVGMGVGLLGTALLAVTVSGAFFTFKSGDVISATDINANFSALKTAIESTREPPIGTILPWHKNMLAAALTLPDGYVECNGQTLSDPDSPFDTYTIPNLNGATGGAANSPGTAGQFGMFLRGGTSSGTGQMDAFQGHYHSLTNAAGNLRIQFGDPTWGVSGVNVNQFTLAVTAPTDMPGMESVRYTTETRPKNMTVVWIMRVK